MTNIFPLPFAHGKFWAILNKITTNLQIAQDNVKIFLNSYFREFCSK